MTRPNDIDDTDLDAIAAGGPSVKAAHDRPPMARSRMTPPEVSDQLLVDFKIIGTKA